MISCFMHLGIACLVLAFTCPEIPQKVSTLMILSDTSFWVVGPTYPNGKYASAMYGNTNPNPYTGGMEIWETTSVSSSQDKKNLTFTKSFDVPLKTVVDGIIYFNADDKAYFYLNEKFTNCFIDSWIPNSAKTCNITQYVNNGSNTIKAVVINNQGGALLSFRLEIILSG